MKRCRARRSSAWLHLRRAEPAATAARLNFKNNSASLFIRPSLKDAETTTVGAEGLRRSLSLQVRAESFRRENIRAWSWLAAMQRLDPLG